MNILNSAHVLIEPGQVGLAIDRLPDAPYVNLSDTMMIGS
jgi:hypothetical protein